MEHAYSRIACLFLILFPVLLATASRAAQPRAIAEFFDAIQAGQVKVVDLSHPLEEQSPYWPEGSTQSPFHARVLATHARDGHFARALELSEHFGTHMDAPLHFDPQGASIDQLPPEKFLGRAIVVDASAAASSNADYRVTAADLEKWVTDHGAMPGGCLVFIRTGWASRWSSQKRYMNPDSQGVLHFPGLSVEAARWLLERVHPVAIGIDTASIDYGPSKDFEVHHLTMTAGLYHLENLANLDRLPAVGVCIIALPLKPRGGSGSPARVLAFVPNESSASR